MKQLFIFILLLKSFSSTAQYNKEKLISILTDDKVKSWSVKGINTELTEKVYSFNIKGTVQTQKGTAANPEVTNGKWVITTKDNIRWFIQINDQQHEMIISYDKSGSQYIKLTHQADSKKSLYYETALHPIKK